MNKNLLPTAAVLALVAGYGRGANAGVTHVTTVYHGTPVAKPSNPAPAGTLGATGGLPGPYTIQSGPFTGGTPGGIGGPVAITVTHSGTLTVAVGDTGQVGDVYQMFFGSTPATLTSQGLTSTPPVVDSSFEGGPVPVFSQGQFQVVGVTPGTYYFDAADVTMQYIGHKAPWGVFVTTAFTTPTGTQPLSGITKTTAAAIVPTNYSPAPTYAPFLLKVTDTYVTTPGVPEPATISLLGSGLISAGLLRRRRRRGR